MKKQLLGYILAAVGALTAVAQSPAVREDAPVGALSGRNIALWQSHGRYFDQKEQRWKWQRCRLFGTVEDLYTRSYVVPFLVPMLENAGAYVMLPRERDESHFEAVIDPDGNAALNGYSETNGKHKWTTSRQPGFGLDRPTLEHGDNPFLMGHSREVKSVTKESDHESEARWSAPVDSTGNYAVYVSYHTSDNSLPAVKYTVHSAVGPKTVVVDQTRGGGTWIYLGTFPFRRSEAPSVLVSLSNRSDRAGVVSADAVRIGGGMGNIARGGQTSGMPRWAEGARYWLQWAGMPDSVYSHEAGADDYRDDIFCRPMWVNHLHQQLNIPVDLVMAFHSDAGTEPGDTTVGTLGIYFTNRRRKFADGRPRALSGQLADSIVTSVVRDIRAAYEPDWVRRPMRDRSYIEARIPEVPSMLLELLSHQNFADMKYGLDPQFKFDVSRAVYKGILRYLSARRLTSYVVTPLAPGSFAIRKENRAGHYMLSWTPTPDPLEPTATTDSYIIEERLADGFWRPLAETSANRFGVEIPRGEIRSFRVIAVNKGGRSFPSEVLSAGWVSATAPEVTVVNGFTRVSAPDNFSEGSMAGFGLTDPGVPMGVDYSFTGRQYDFQRDNEWTHDDSPGFGASHADRETIPVSGNTLDYTVIHGRALMSAGRSFVSTSVNAFIDDSLSTPGAVDLILGLQRETVIGRGVRPAAHKAFPLDLQWRLKSLAERGVPMFVSGAYVGTDLSSATDFNFAREVLGFEYRTANATALGGVSEVSSAFYRDFSGGRFLFGMRPGDEPYRVPSADAIYPASPLGATIMRYDGSQAPAAVAFAPTSHRAVTLGFPFEAIRSESARNSLMKQIIAFFND